MEVLPLRQQLLPLLLQLCQNGTEGTGKLGTMHFKRAPANQTGLGWKKPLIRTQTEHLSCGCLQQVLGKAPELFPAGTWELTLFCPKTSQQHSSLLTEL